MRDAMYMSGCFIVTELDHTLIDLSQTVSQSALYMQMQSHYSAVNLIEIDLRRM
jgi:hypothetical protein